MEKIRIGHIIGPFGLRGELKVFITTSIPLERFKVGSIVEVGKSFSDLQVFEIASFKFKNEKVAIVKFVGYDDINQIEHLTHQNIYTDKTPLTSGYYIDDLIGLNIVNSRGVQLGKVDDAHLLNDRFYLLSGKFYLPLIENIFIERIELEEKKIYVTSLGEELFE